MSKVISPYAANGAVQVSRDRMTAFATLDYDMDANLLPKVADGTRILVVTDLRRLQYFVQVARERNFTRAAERLHVAQPALSRHVRLLEQDLGVELLFRTAHEFELTEAGEFLLERAPALLTAADELWRSVRTYGTGEPGAVKVAYGGSASYETVPRLLRALAERHPGIAMATSVKSVDEIVAGLGDGSIDLGLVRCPPRAPHLEVRAIRMEPQGLLLRRDHALAALVARYLATPDLSAAPGANRAAN